MAEQHKIHHQEENSTEEPTFYECEDHHTEEDQSPSSDDDDDVQSKGIWEEFDMEFHKLIQNLASKLHLESLLQEKPDDVEDKSAISSWLDNLINLIKGNQKEEEDSELVFTTRSAGFSGDEAVAKLERFKVKNLATTTDTLKDVKKVKDVKK